MLAPRKKLWSSPPEVMLAALDLLQLTSEDVVFDIGAGDGSFVIRAAQDSPVSAAVGIEICEQRGIDPERCRIICGNALEQDISRATCFFLYLVPRGLRIILKKLVADIPPHRKLRIVTYMSPLGDVPPTATRYVSTLTHPEARWPLYYYEVELRQFLALPPPPPPLGDADEDGGGGGGGGSAGHGARADSNSSSSSSMSMEGSEQQAMSIPDNTQP
eukprot:gene31321-40696_t